MCLTNGNSFGGYSFFQNEDVSFSIAADVLVVFVMKHVINEVCFRLYQRRLTSSMFQMFHEVVIMNILVVSLKPSFEPFSIFLMIE